MHINELMRFVPNAVIHQAKAYSRNMNGSKHLPLFVARNNCCDKSFYEINGPWEGLKS